LGLYNTASRVDVSKAGKKYCPSSGGLRNGLTVRPPFISLITRLGGFGILSFDEIAAHARAAAIESADRFLGPTLGLPLPDDPSSANVPDVRRSSRIFTPPSLSPFSTTFKDRCTRTLLSSVDLLSERSLRPRCSTSPTDASQLHYITTPYAPAATKLADVVSRIPLAMPRSVLPSRPSPLLVTRRRRRR
jgi:hypothetical protein